MDAIQAIGTEPPLVDAASLLHWGRLCSCVGSYDSASSQSLVIQWSSVGTLASAIGSDPRRGLAVLLQAASSCLANREPVSRDGSGVMVVAAFVLVLCLATGMLRSASDLPSKALHGSDALPPGTERSKTQESASELSKENPSESAQAKSPKQRKRGKRPASSEDDERVSKRLLRTGSMTWAEEWSQAVGIASKLLLSANQDSV